MAKRTTEMIAPDMQAVINASRKHAKLAVTVGVGAEMLGLCVSMGFNMIVSGGDVMFLAAGSKQASTDARAMLKQMDSSKETPKARLDQVGSPY